MTLLDWREAYKKREDFKPDKQLIQRFVCCFCRRRKKPPYGRLCPDWEHIVQRGIHVDMAHRPSPRELMLFGFDDDGLAALSWSDELSSPADVKIRAMAIATRCRYQRNGYADELVEQTIQRLMGRAAVNHALLDVECDVHEDNRNSQKLCQRSGLQHTGNLGDLELWGIRLDLT